MEIVFPEFLSTLVTAVPVVGVLVWYIIELRKRYDRDIEYYRELVQQARRRERIAILACSDLDSAVFEISASNGHD